MCGSRVDKKAADMLWSELKTERDSCHSSVASRRLRFAAESKPDHAGQTCSNQLLMSSDEVSVMEAGTKVGPSGNRSVDMRLDVVTSCSASRQNREYDALLEAGRGTDVRRAIFWRGLTDSPEPPGTGIALSSLFLLSVALETDAKLLSGEKDSLSRGRRGSEAGGPCSVIRNTPSAGFSSGPSTAASLEPG